MLHGTETIPCVRDEPGEIAAVCSSGVDLQPRSERYTMYARCAAS